MMDFSSVSNAVIDLNGHSLSVKSGCALLCVDIRGKGTLLCNVVCTSTAGGIRSLPTRENMFFSGFVQMRYYHYDP